jgi:hypothetical protein
MEFLMIDQTASSADGQILCIPMARIIKVLKNEAPWGDEACVVKVFHDDGGGSDAAIEIVKGAATGKLGKGLGLADDAPTGAEK